MWIIFKILRTTYTYFLCLWHRCQGERKWWWPFTTGVYNRRQVGALFVRESRLSTQADRGEQSQVYPLPLSLPVPACSRSQAGVCVAPASRCQVAAGPSQWGLRRRWPELRLWLQQSVETAAREKVGAMLLLIKCAILVGVLWQLSHGQEVSTRIFALFHSVSIFRTLSLWLALSLIHVLVPTYLSQLLPPCLPNWCLPSANAFVHSEQRIRRETFGNSHHIPLNRDYDWNF